MINDNFRFKGILPGTALFEMSNHFVKTYGRAEPITAPKPIKEVWILNPAVR
ncbi:hypothetical protein D3C72_2363710 [compost metagenome]